MTLDEKNSEEYKRVRLLGKGSYGKAYLAESLSNSELCVLKEIDITRMLDEEQFDTVKEARILEALRHPNIIRFREVYKTKKGRLCIVMDYADGGDLSHKIKQNGNMHFTEIQILDWFTQMCLAIKHVHDRKIIHRDLKTQNIFLTTDGIIKLGDFGIARVLNHTREKCKTIVGTPYYLSPEIIESKDYSFKTDIWSLGVILYELCALKPPFNAESLHGLALQIVMGNYAQLPQHFSQDIKQLIDCLLQVDPNRRPNINEVLKFPILAERLNNIMTESLRKAEFSHTVLHQKHFVNCKTQSNTSLDQKSVDYEVVQSKATNKQRRIIQQPSYPVNPEYFTKQLADVESRSPYSQLLNKVNCRHRQYKSKQSVSPYIKQQNQPQSDNNRYQRKSPFTKDYRIKSPFQLEVHGNPVKNDNNQQKLNNLYQQHRAQQKQQDQQPQPQYYFQIQPQTRCRYRDKFKFELANRKLKQKDSNDLSKN